MAYKDLSIRERAAIIRDSVFMGVHRLSDIERMYDVSQVEEEKITV